MSVSWFLLSGFVLRFSGAGMRVQDVGFLVSVSWYLVSGFVLRFLGAGLRVQDVGPHSGLQRDFLNNPQVDGLYALR